jgi:UDP:flavonoid glycosyltransferase YjiC (YdhE family)
MHFLMTPVGSSGDVHPFVGLAGVLQARGHKVTICSAEPHRDVVQRAGAAFVPIFSAKDYLAATHDPDLWHPRRGLNKVLEMARLGLEPTWQALEERYQPGRTVLVGHPASFATRAFEEKTGAPAATLHLAPGSIRSAHRVPALPPGVDISAMPLWFKRGLWVLVDRWAVDRQIGPAFNQWRAGKGLPPVRRLFKEWINSPRATIGLFPDWFGPMQPDWPATFHHASFPLWDDAPGAAADPELEAFLAAGTPPVVFSPGSANRQASAFFEAARGALGRLRRRGLFLTAFPEQLPRALPDTILHRAYAPFSVVLPRAAAFVHHGGIGSTAQGLATGVPQLMMPMGFDQPDNALRAERLGVARWLTPGRFRGARLARELAVLMESPLIRDAAAAVRDRLAGVDGLARAADLLEEIAAGPPTPK